MWVLREQKNSCLFSMVNEVMNMTDEEITEQKIQCENCHKRILYTDAVWTYGKNLCLDCYELQLYGDIRSHR